jgi:hypothetical protein
MSSPFFWSLKVMATVSQSKISGELRLISRLSRKQAPATPELIAYPSTMPSANQPAAPSRAEFIEGSTFITIEFARFGLTARLGTKEPTRVTAKIEAIQILVRGDTLKPNLNSVFAA